MLEILEDGNGCKTVLVNNMQVVEDWFGSIVLPSHYAKPGQYGDYYVKQTTDGRMAIFYKEKQISDRWDIFMTEGLLSNKSPYYVAGNIVDIEYTIDYEKNELRIEDYVLEGAIFHKDDRFTPISPIGRMREDTVKGLVEGKSQYYKFEKDNKVAIFKGHFRVSEWFNYIYAFPVLEGFSPYYYAVSCQSGSKYSYCGFFHVDFPTPITGWVPTENYLYYEKGKSYFLVDNHFVMLKLACPVQVAKYLHFGKKFHIVEI